VGRACRPGAVALRSVGGKWSWLTNDQKGNEWDLSERVPPFSHLSHLECGSCGRRYDADVPQGVCACGSPLLAPYDLTSVAGAVRPADFRNIGSPPDYGGRRPYCRHCDGEPLESIPREYIEAGRALGAGKWYNLLHVRVRAALPGIVTGCVSPWGSPGRASWPSR